MENIKSYITNGQFLGVNDYLASNNGVFFAIMQSDGNFCVYRGSGPNDNHGGLWCYSDKPMNSGQFFAVMQDDGNFCVYKGTNPNDNRGGVWCYSKEARPRGQFFAVMQDDGNFCVYKGSPSNNQGGVWCTAKTDPIVDIIDISTIDYDVNNARIVSKSTDQLYHETLKNDTSQAQDTTISGRQSVTETRGWSDTLGLKVGASTSFETGIPLIVDGKVTVSVDVTTTFTWNGSTTTAKEWSWSTKVIVPAQTIINSLVSVAVTKLAVPYTLNATVKLKSGTSLRGKIHGIYTGTNSHDLEVTDTQTNLVTRALSETKRSL